MRVAANRPASDAVADLRARFRFRVQPALALLSPDGDILDVQYAHLYPAYHFNGVEMSSWTERLWTSKDILAWVERVEDERRADDARLAALAAREDAASLATRGAMLADRGRPERARELLERAWRRQPLPAAGEPLAELHAWWGRNDEAREIYAALADQHPDHARASLWRMLDARLLAMQPHRATLPDAPSTPDPAYAAALRTLETLSEKATDPLVALRSRLSLGRAAYASGDTAALQAHLRWITARIDPEQDCPEGWSAAMLLELADLELVAGGGFEQRATEHAWAVTRCFPGSVEAQRVKHGMLDGNVRIAAPR